MSLLNLGLHYIIMNIFIVFNIVVTRVLILTFNDSIFVYCILLREFRIGIISQLPFLEASFFFSHIFLVFSIIVYIVCRLGKIKYVCMSVCLRVCVCVYACVCVY